MQSPTAAKAEDQYTLLKLDNQIMKWGVPKLGMPASVTYAFATAPFFDPEARNCKGLVPFGNATTISLMSVAIMRREAVAATHLWSQIAGITFKEIEDPSTADILIGEQAEPRGYAFANVEYERPLKVKAATTAHNRGLGFPAAAGEDPGAARGTRVTPIKRAMICLNPEKTWKQGIGGPTGGYDLQYTLAHEFGHAIGLDHYNRPGNLMYFKYTEDFRVPQKGDIAGARALYGLPVAAP